MTLLSEMISRYRKRPCKETNLPNLSIEIVKNFFSNFTRETIAENDSLVFLPEAGHKCSIT
jgi:hypothetical protein